MSESPPIVIYGAPATRSTRALWALEEAGLPYQLHRVELMRGAHRLPDYLAVNPGGKVPTLVQGDFVLRESGAIVTWVGQQVPASGLVPPAGTPAFAHYLQWVCFVLSELEQPLWTTSKHTFALPEKLRVPAVIPTAAKEFARAAAVLAEGLAGRTYLVGDTFTMADLLAAHTLAWARVQRQELGPELAAYADRHLGRPALARATAAERAPAGG